jgi:hypothetical protein
MRDDAGFYILDRASKQKTRLGLYKWGIVSPDGLRILPENSFEVMNMDGSGRRRLVETEDDVYVKTAWMPNGNILLIMAKAYEENGSQKDRQKAVLSEFRLTDSSNSFEVVRSRDIQVDPLNNAILFSPRKDRLAAQYSLGSPRWVKIVDLATMAETQLPDEQNTKTSSVLFCWSPDGKYLVYQTGGNFFISDMKGVRTRIDVTNCVPVSFTPDSKYLLVKRFKVFRTRLLYSDLHFYGLDGREVQNLTRNSKIMEGDVFLVGDGEILYTDTTDFKKEYFRVMKLQRIGQ